MWKSEQLSLGMPTSASESSQSNRSVKGRRNWADLTDDHSSDDQIWTTSTDNQIWTPSSSSLRPTSYSSLPNKADLSDEPDDPASSLSPQPLCLLQPEVPLEVDQPLQVLQRGLQRSARSAAMAARWQANSERTASWGAGKDFQAAQSSTSTIASDSSSRFRRSAESKTAAAAHLLTSQMMTPGDDARFWVDAASNAESSGSEVPVGHARPPAWSAGAELHANGNCHPCIFHAKVVGCDNGANCVFCHLAHESRDRHRRNMRRRHEQRENMKAHGDSGTPQGKQEEDGLRIRNPEDVTFMLPSALHRLNNGWPQSAAEAPVSQVSGSSGYAGADAEAREQPTELGSVFTSFLAPLFGAGSSGPTTSAEPDVHNHGCFTGKADGKGRRESRRSKARAQQCRAAVASTPCRD